jgi:hypothetical protein
VKLDAERTLGRCPCTTIAILRRGLPVVGAIGIQSDADCVSECVTGAGAMRQFLRQYGHTDMHARGCEPSTARTNTAWS